MKLEVEAYEGELRKLRQAYEVIRHLDLAEKLGDIYFICGYGGARDDNGLPEKLHICPAYGVDWFQIYERTPNSAGTEW